MTYQEWEKRLWDQGVTPQEARDAMGVSPVEFEQWPQQIWVSDRAQQWLLALEQESREL